MQEETANQQEKYTTKPTQTPKVSTSWCHPPHLTQIQATGNHFVPKPPQVCPGHEALLPQLSLPAGDSLPSAIGEVIPLLSSVDVTLGPRGPEDRPDILHSSLGVGTDCPGQRPPAWEEQMLT